MPTRRAGLQKAPTGIPGLDEILRGGVPRGRGTLLVGGTGCGKSVLALQTLVHGARALGEPGIFVAFEESAERIVANAASFGWDLPALQRKRLFFLDAQPSPDVLATGDADLEGILAALDARVVQMGARRIVLDSLDVLLSLVGDAAAAQREMGRLTAWLAARDLTVLMTSRATAPGRSAPGALDFLPFAADCVLTLRHDDVLGVSQRSVRVEKYRGSAFAENASAMMIGPEGMQLAGVARAQPRRRASQQRISTGVHDLDAMLGGGYRRGSSVLITGAPGTAKTTLGGAFAEATCARGERALFVSFDSAAAEVQRDLASVGVRLSRFVARGLLQMETRHAAEASAEAHLLDLRRILDAHRPTSLVIDPISALGEQGNERTAHDVVARLIALAKDRDITVLCTSLLTADAPLAESSRLRVSTIADTWIHLTYAVHAGERNRALTVVKSRGTAHSHQVRELVLGRRGLALTDVYAAEGEVLMGSLRLQREQADAALAAQRAAEEQRRRLQAERVHEELVTQIRQIERELQSQDAEAALMADTERRAESTRQSDRQARIGRRGPGRPR